MVKLDQYLVNKAQAIYDYLLDTFGIMRGTIAMFLMSINVAMAIIAYNSTGNLYSLVTIVASVAIILSANVDRKRQLRGSHTAINAMALLVRQSFPILVVKAICILHVVFYVITFMTTGLLWTLAVEFFNLAVTAYILCVFTRGPETRYEDKFAFNGA